MSLLKKTWNAAKSEGIGFAIRKMRRWAEVHRNSPGYQKWIRQYETVSPAERLEVAKRIESFNGKPLISVVMPVYDVDEVWLRRAIESVLGQYYPHWELCIADDNSTKPHIRRILDEYAAKDERIKVVFRETNGHISAASNSAFELAAGDFTALLDHDDELSKRALFLVAEAIKRFPDADLFYTDEDLIDTNGRRYDPQFKPDWSPDTFYAVNFTNHLSVYRTSLIRSIGGWRLGFEGSQDYDLMLRAIERIGPGKVRHIPHVLYHWRAVPGSVALSSSEKTYAHTRARASIDEHFSRSGLTANAVKGTSELHRVVYALDPQPFVSVIVSGGPEIEKTLRGIVAGTEYESYEIVAACERPSDDLPLDSRIKFTGKGGESRFQIFNHAARIATGEVICFLEGSTEIRQGGWLRELVARAMQKTTGAAGGKILFLDRTIKHAGLLTGIADGVGRAHYRFSDGHFGYNMRLSVEQNFSAVSADCLAIRKKLFDAAGGFDAGDFPSVYADVDLCLRLRESGYRNVWTPWAEVVQSGAPPVPDGAELARLKEKWPAYFEKDPYFNVNLSNESDDFSLSFPPRIGKFDL